MDAVFQAYVDFRENAADMPLFVCSMLQKASTGVFKNL